MITVDGDGIVKSIDHITKSGARINGGFFLFRREIFKYMEAGDELVEEPFRRLIAAGQLLSRAHDGFWACMDTFKEMQELEDLYSRGNAPWMVWNRPFYQKTTTGLTLSRESAARTCAHAMSAMTERKLK
jgi:glucose-1-phosphate cytidylyltransferase